MTFCTARIAPATAISAQRHRKSRLSAIASSHSAFAAVVVAQGEGGHARQIDATHLGIQFANVTAGNITPAPGETYTVVLVGA